MDYEKCDCNEWPDGFICGKPGCERTVRAEAAIENIVRTLARLTDSSSTEKK